ncbi:DUF2790 domain-containing protein [Pseudomonas pseudonitroreducens]|uniref:DUF2790 domain-containing protein n=1 Tax=Pseudomonas pseudonitroreducens TaxID=2892326 RepID=UPI001F21A398|nr:DUF2790 domain-containing protein [Pseudomonas pseudonitroreducens]
MKTQYALLFTVLIGSTSLASADGGGDITFSRMQQAREQAMAARQPTPIEVAQAKQYTYGMDLDIAEVVSVTPLSRDCGVVPVQMRYKDSFGEEQLVEYRQERFACRSIR